MRTEQEIKDQLEIYRMEKRDAKTLLDQHLAQLSIDILTWVLM